MTASADNPVHITYMSYVDPASGFYRVLDETTHQPSQYVDRILTINQGDTVIWKNDADTPNTAVTIVSEQHLFPDAVLNTNTAVFPYVFDQEGKYTFHVGEHTPSVQTIMVRTVNAPVPSENAPLTFLNSDPKDTVVNSSINEQVAFSITISQPGDVTWSLNNVKVKYDPNAVSSNYIATASTIGMSIVDVYARSINSSASKEWKWVIGVPTATGNTPVPTTITTTIIPIVATPVYNPIIVTNIDPIVKYSPIQIIGMIIIILSIYITYKTGKDKNN
jgi:hypothetical protein